MDTTFLATMENRQTKGGWTYVVMPEAVDVFGRQGLVKIRGTIDGHPLQSSFMATGDGGHMSPTRAESRALIEKDEGDVISIQVLECLPR